MNSEWRKRALVLLSTLLLSAASFAQTNEIATDASSAPLALTLNDALTRARANEPQYRAALTRYGVARQAMVQSRAGLLPNVNYNAQFLYTEGNSSSARFRKRNLKWTAAGSN